MYAQLKISEIEDSAREKCAREVEALKMGELRLAMGEMTAQERRTCKSLLGYIAHRIRNPKKSG